MITFTQYSQDRSIANRNALVKLNMGLVKKYANIIGARPGAELDDLIQVGYVGLIRAIERYDIDKGYAFSSFAVPYIRGEMLHYIRDRSHAIRPPRQFANLIGKSCKFNCNTHTEMAEALEVTVDEWKQAKQSHRPTRSLEERLYRDAENTLGDTIAIPDTTFDKLVVEDLLSNLPNRHRAILEMNFLEERTYREIGSAMGLSCVTVSRNRKEALRRLQELVA